MTRKAYFWLLDGADHGLELAEGDGVGGGRLVHVPIVILERNVHSGGKARDKSR